MKTTLKTIVTTSIALISIGRCSPSMAEEPANQLSSLKGVWSVMVGFGEIPFLAGSFKPSVSAGYHVNDYVYLGSIVQMRDVLERGTESFNAVDTGLGGIQSTREETGARFLLEARLRPHRYSPYLTIGGVFNGSDTEVMRFDDRTRTIGSGTYDGAVTLEQTRPFGVGPAIGLGYEYTFQTGLTLSTQIAGAFFMGPPTPTVRVESDAPISDADEAALRKKIQDAFSDNLHNNYHMFNIGAGHSW